MPKVKVSQKISGEKKAIYKAVKTYLSGRDTLSKLGAEIEWDDKGHSASIESDSFSGSITLIEAGKQCEVEILIDLPLLLTPFKAKVEEELKKHLGRITV